MAGPDAERHVAGLLLGGFLGGRWEELRARAAGKRGRSLASSRETGDRRTRIGGTGVPARLSPCELAARRWSTSSTSGRKSGEQHTDRSEPFQGRHLQPSSSRRGEE